MVLIVYDVTNQDSFTACSEWISKIMALKSSTDSILLGITFYWCNQCHELISIMCLNSMLKYMQLLNYQSIIMFDKLVDAMQVLWWPIE